MSLPLDDVAFIDDYAARTGAKSRSAVLHRAIDLLRSVDLEDAYASAWQEWESGDDAEAWEPTSADGIAGAAR